MSGHYPDALLEGRHNPLALEAVRRAPIKFLERALSVHDRQIRCRLPRPGGAVRKADAYVRLADRTDLSVVKPRRADGNEISVILGFATRLTLVGDQLRILRRDLPDTVLVAMEGRRVGETMELGGILTDLADTRIVAIDEDLGYPKLILDLPHVDITRGDICRDALGDPVQQHLI